MSTEDPDHRTDHQPDKRPAEESSETVIPFRPRRPAPVSDPDPDGPAAA